MNDSPNRDASSLERKIVALELAMAHLQRHHDTLNEVVTEHGKQLQHLQRALKTLAGRLDSVEFRTQRDPRGSLEDERPPHY